jgi:hypothetical protein
MTLLKMGATTSIAMPCADGHAQQERLIEGQVITGENSSHKGEEYAKTIFHHLQPMTLDKHGFGARVADKPT